MRYRMLQASRDALSPPSRMCIPCWAFSILLLALPLHGISAQADEVLALLPADLSAVFVEAFAPDVLHVQAAVTAGLDCQAWKAVVAVGDEQARAVLAHCPSARLIVTHTSRAALERLRHDHPTAMVTAVFLEPPPAAQLQLLHEAVPQARRVGVLYGQWSASQLPELRTTAARLGLSLHAAEVEAGVHPARVLHDMVGEIDALLALADPLLLDANSIKPLLLGSARHSVALIGGPTPGYIRAGIALGAFASDAASARHAAVLARRMARASAPAPVYADEFQIHTNEYVSRILNIKSVTKIRR